MNRPATPPRRHAALSLAAGAAALALPALAHSAAAPLRVGYAIARTGPWAMGAQVTQEPNYLMWAERHNAAGGIDVAGRRRPIQLQGFDDRSDVATGLRIYERLMNVERVDLILPPWGSSATAALSPLANRLRYPLLAPTEVTRRLVDMNMPYYFAMLQQPDRMMGALVEMLAAHGARTLAFVYMDDLFGLENFAALNAALKRSEIRVVDRRSYLPGTVDLSATLASFKSQAPDAFVGITYPGETLRVSQQARAIGFNPKFFFTAIGTAFPGFRDELGTVAEGVCGMGCWNPRSRPAARAYFDAHVRRFGREPDRWGSGHCHASLEIMDHVLARVGLDRRAQRDLIATTTFETVIGPVRFAGSENDTTPGAVGQWQGGEFEIVWPRERATAALQAPKPAWR